MIYKIEKNKTHLRILGKEFVENNGNKGFLIINNKKFRLKEIEEIKKRKIILMINKNIYNKSCMFKNCNLLESFSKILSDEDIENVNKLEKKIDDEYYSHITKEIVKEEDSSDYYMGVKNNSTISNISQRDDSINNSEKSKLIYIYKKLTNSTKNFILLNEMFSNCESLLSLPDISKFETNNVIHMSYMFSNCKSLLSLPDISK